MTVNSYLKSVVAGLVLSAVLGAPVFLQAKEKGQNPGKELSVHLVRTLKIQPDKVRMFMDVEEKYDRVRREAFERIKKSMGLLEQLLANKKPDAKKLKDVIAAIASDQNILVNTYKLRRDEQLAILTPLQQGEYLLTTWKWQQKLIGKYGKHENEQKNKGKKEKDQ